MTQETIDKIKGLAIAAGILYAVYRLAPGGAATKAAVLGVAGVMIAKQTPYVKNAI